MTAEGGNPNVARSADIRELMASERKRTVGNEGAQGRAATGVVDR
jgi:hypothetical protein